MKCVFISSLFLAAALVGCGEDDASRENPEYPSGNPTQGDGQREGTGKGDQTPNGADNTDPMNRGTPSPTQNGTDDDPTQVGADNTDRNERDADGNTLTPGAQSESPSDIEITARARRAILEDPAMSVNAHNVKIMTDGGDVTLRGPVANVNERAAIETHVRNIPGVIRIDNQLDVLTQ